MSDAVLGRCSLCGGDVVLPRHWAGVGPAPRTCAACGAVESKSNLPVIQMERPKTEDVGDLLRKIFPPKTTDGAGR